MMLGASRLTQAEQIELLDDLASFVRAGLPPFEAIDAIAAVSRRRNRRRHYACLAKILAKMKAGRSFSEAASGLLDDTAINIVNSGERSGDMVSALQQSAYLLKQRREMRALVLSALTKPAINLVALIGLVYYVAIQVVPAAKKLLPKEYMSDLSKAYFAFGEWMITYTPMVALAIALVSCIIAASMPIWTGTLRDAFDRKVFPWTIYRYVQAGAFLVAVRSMMRSGMPLAQALEIMVPLARGWLKSKLAAVKKHLARGLEEAEAIHKSGILPEEIDDRLSVYGKLPNFTDIMEPLASDTLDRAKKKLAMVSGTIGTVSMVMIAIFILFTVFGLGDAALSASDAASRKSSSM